MRPTERAISRAVAAACRVSWPVLGLLLVVVASVATAEERHVASADELCPPSIEPCTIVDPVTIDPPGDFDLGLRNIIVAPGGRIRAERATILCGSFWTVGPESRVGVLIPDTDAYASFSVTARRSCSLSPPTPCLDDGECTPYGLGLCSVGQGVITLGAAVEGNREYGSDVELRAAGDITLSSRISLNGTGAGGSAGYLGIWSSTGNVQIAGPIAINGAPPHDDYYGGFSGSLSIFAERDLEVTAPIAGAALDMHLGAGRDLRIRNNLSRNAVDGTPAGEGGPGSFRAGRDIIVEPHGSADDQTFITANGGNWLMHYYGYDLWTAGRGGYTSIETGGNFIVERKARFHSDSPQDDCADGVPWGGYFYISADEGFLIDGPITARGTGCGGRGGRILISSYGDGAVGPHARLDASAGNAGWVRLDASGNLDIEGTLDTHGDTVAWRSHDGGDPYFYGSGGWVALHGDDLTVSGDVLLGGLKSGSFLDADACRLRITSTGLIDNRCPHDGDGQCGSDEYMLAFAQQSLIVETGARVLGEPDLRSMMVAYGNPDQPPVLSGTFVPPPNVYYAPWLLHDGCPSCGDGEIEENETCDDWNVTDGDGCNSRCVNEHCIAQTPGYPATPLCDDHSACTDDRCEPLAGVCLHEPACADAVACTQETCVEDACVVTAVDASCDDHDPCTTDLCNASTGCVHAALVAVACDDNDVCTTASACEEAAGCIASDPRPAFGGRMSIDTRAARRGGMLVAKLDVPAAEVLAPITASGVGIRVVDDGGNVLVDTYLPGALFSGQVPPDFDYRFEDPSGSIAEADGVRLLHVRRKSAVKAAVQLRIKRPDLDAARSADAFTLSIVFGPDPASDGCATLALRSCHAGKKITCRG